MSDLLARGVLTRGAHWTDWVREYCEHLRGIAAGRIDPATADERKRLLAARASRAELELELRQRQLVNASAVERAARQLARSARDALRAVPPRLAPLLAPIADAAEIERALDREIDAVCAELAALPKKLQAIADE